MQSLTGKNTGDSLTAAEWNQLPQEVQNVITKFLGLSSGDLNQLNKAIAGYVGQGDFFIDSGSSNSYILGANGVLQLPTNYGNGLRVRFKAGSSNTSASTINLGGLGVRPLLSVTAAPLPTGSIIAGRIYQATYDPSADGGNGAFLLLQPEGGNALTLDGALPDVNPTNDTIVKRNASGEIDATNFLLNGNSYIEYVSTGASEGYIWFRSINKVLMFFTANPAQKNLVVSITPPTSFDQGLGIVATYASPSSIALTTEISIGASWDNVAQEIDFAVSSVNGPLFSNYPVRFFFLANKTS